jgi:hypothetical protein
MIRKLLCTLVAVALFAGVAGAEVLKGKVKSVDEKKITVTVDEKDKTFDLTKDVKVTTVGKKAKVMDLPGGISAVKVGDEVTLTTEKKGEKEVVVEVVAPAGKKKKKDK